jgi:hypothetical protein
MDYSEKLSSKSRHPLAAFLFSARISKFILSQGKSTGQRRGEFQRLVIPPNSLKWKKMTTSFLA